MANRNFYPDGYSLNRETVHLYGKMVIGASGAISSSSCKGFSVTKTASETGRYTITLEDVYYDLLGCDVTMALAADAALTASSGVFTGVRNVAVSTATSKTFDIQFALTADAGHTDTDPYNGATIYINIHLKNTAV